MKLKPLLKKRIIMENTTAAFTETLNDLVLINNDRIAGYEKALEELKSRDEGASQDLDLTVLFQRMIAESRENRMALGHEVQVHGGEMAEGTLTSGKLYRVWMDVRAAFSGKDRHAILASCEGGEDAALRAYNSALEEEELPTFLRDLVSSQKDTIKRSHDEIKALRDQSA